MQAQLPQKQSQKLKLSWNPGRGEEGRGMALRKIHLQGDKFRSTDARFLLMFRVCAQKLESLRILDPHVVKLADSGHQIDRAHLLVWHPLPELFGKGRPQVISRPGRRL